ncbi:MAG: DUF167 domain-containing protein [Alloacidobacterium sp.]|jgi:uncharacterized protein (TIGR00251 family)
MIALRETAAGVSFSVRAQPRASRTAISGIVGDAVKVALAAPPVEGKANEVLIRFFAELFEVPRAAVEIVSGESSRNKVVRVAGVSADIIRARLRD